ncbi:Mating-type ALPHA2 [Fusarium sp. NRRL 52700]|nr:Mating-type ALPHA2 [Fusarium sp. NRRL 52700]
MRVDKLDMGDTNYTEHPAPPDATSSSGEPLLDFDALAFDPGTLESNTYGPAFENGLEGNEFEFTFDGLWSADMTQLPLTTDDTEFTQTHQLQGDTSLHHDGLQRPGTDQLALNFGDLMRNVSESPSSTRSPSILTPPIPSPLPPKIGHRFTLDAIRSLKDWFARNADNPYPNEEEKNMLELQTGLTRTQITNWLANARRRRTTTDSGTQTASGKSGKAPSEYTPTRAGTPIPRRRSEKGMHPLQRWVDSPPENEPAAVSAIARAMASGELVTSSTVPTSQDKIKADQHRKSKSERHILR